MKIQKQKLIDLFKKHQHKITQTNKFKKILKFKKKKIAKFRKFRNAHRDNFDKINAKIKSLMFDKKTMQKTIENLKRKLQFVQSYLFLNDSNRKNEKSSSQKTNKTKKKSIMSDYFDEKNLCRFHITNIENKKIK